MDQDKLYKEYRVKALAALNEGDSFLIICGKTAEEEGTNILAGNMETVTHATAEALATNEQMRSIICIALQMALDSLATPITESGDESDEES